MKCGHTYCKLGGSVDKAVAKKAGNRYYHKECLKEKDDFAQIVKFYYKYYQSKESKQNVNSVLSDMIYKGDMSAEYVLFVLCKCIRKRIQLKSIYYFKAVCGNKEYESEYLRYMYNKKLKNFNFNKVETKKPEAKQYIEKNKKESWTDTLFGK